jgi:anthranilate/para-aminobenzoate synthase component II
MILVLDNYDSFTWNLVQFLGELRAEPRVVRNDQATVDEIRALSPSKILISPGPCTPREAGISIDLVQALGPFTPTLGVCLGHRPVLPHHAWEDRPCTPQG